MFLPRVDSIDRSMERSDEKIDALSAIFPDFLRHPDGVRWKQRKRRADYCDHSAPTNGTGLGTGQLGRIELAVAKDIVMNRLLTTCFAICMACVVHADEVDIPNQFTAGSAAVAAEVNANFAAVEVAVDDNAQRVVALETGLGTVGLAVKVDGVVIGRYMTFGTAGVEVDLPVAAGGGTVRVTRALGAINSGTMRFVSPTGYMVEMVASDFVHPVLTEGEIVFSFIFFDGTDCTGNKYFPVQGDTGRFSTFTPGVGDLEPLKRWAARQGVVFASPDQADPNIAYMMRAGAAVQTVALGSFLVYATALNQPFCVNMATIPGFDINNPLHVNHTVVPVEANDVAVSGVASDMGGQITVGL